MSKEASDVPENDESIDLEYQDVVRAAEIDELSIDYAHDTQDQAFKEMHAKLMQSGVLEEMRSTLVSNWSKASDAERRRYRQLEKLVVKAACQAIGYDESTDGKNYHGEDWYGQNRQDKYSKERQKDSAAFDNISAQIKAIEKLKTFAQRHAKFARKAWHNVNIEHGISIPLHSEGRHEIELLKVLDAYSKDLNSLKKQHQSAKEFRSEILQIAKELMPSNMDIPPARIECSIFPAGAIQSIYKPIPTNKIQNDRQSTPKKVTDQISTRFLRHLNGPPTIINSIEYLSRCGPINFGTEIDGRSGRTINGAETGLLFQLTIYFRRFTNNCETERLGDMRASEPMPNSGTPHWKVSSEVLACVFDKEPDQPAALERRINKLVQKYPSISFVGWP